MTAALLNALLMVLAFVGFVALVGVGCLCILLEVGQLRLTLTSRTHAPQATPDEAAYVVTSERLRVLELDALARLADMRHSAEAEQGAGAE